MFDEKVQRLEKVCCNCLALPWEPEPRCREEEGKRLWTDLKRSHFLDLVSNWTASGLHKERLPRTA